MNGTGESPEIRAFIDLRTKLQATPLAGYWRGPVADYLDLADDFATKTPSGWVSGYLTDVTAFTAQSHQAAAEAQLLGLAVAQLDALTDETELAPGWQTAVLASMERVALIAGSWGEGIDTLRGALLTLPGDLAQRYLQAAAAAGRAVSSVEQTLENLAPSAGPLALVAGGLVLLGTGVYLAYRASR